MKIEIWSDIACPWCYIGKHRFEDALARFEGRESVEVTYRSFQLDPTAPPVSSGSLNELLSSKFGIPVAQAEAMNTRMTEMGEPEGIAFHFDRARPANTFDAHRVVHLANEHGKGSAMKERLFQAYFRDGLVVSDPATLVELAREEDLDARDVVSSAQFTDNVREDIETARELGISGVPFFVFDEKYGVSGAQTADVLLSTMREAAKG